MATATATVKTLGELFTLNAFVVPEYQRSYAWETRKTSDSKDHQVEDFWEDIKDAFHNNQAQIGAGKSPQPYYWGTLTLKRNLPGRRDGFAVFPEYIIVDGQQRLMTAMLFLIAFNTSLPVPKNMLTIGSDPRLKVSTLNINAFSDLISSSPVIRDNLLRTNKRLCDAVEYFRDQIKCITPPGDLTLLLDYFLNTTIALEFDAGSSRLAIQAFLSLNDRGKPLTVLEKMKGFLSSYDINYLGGSLAGSINRTFSKVYIKLDELNAIGDKGNLPFFKSFDDEQFLRLVYHYSARVFICKYELNNYLSPNYRATSNQSLEFFRDAAKLLVPRSSNLEHMICDLLCNMELVSDALGSIATQTTVGLRSDFLKLFRFLEINPALVICLVGAQINGFLSQSLIKELENVDVRVFKVSGLNKITPLYDGLIPKLRDSSDFNMISALKGYRNWLAPDPAFIARIAQLYGVSKDNYMLWEYQKFIDKNFSEFDTSLFDTVSTVEHVFAETPRIGFPGCGFTTDVDYALSLHLSGNLSLLSPADNSAVSNLTPIDKARDKIYRCSPIPDIRRLSVSIIAAGRFEKNDVDARTTEFQEFAIKRWS